MRVFVTGASGWIGSAVVPELVAAGHQVVGLARSEDSAAALEAAGAQVQSGSLDDLDVLGSAAAAADGVIHLAFKHDQAFSGNYQGAAEADLRAITALGEALAKTDRPLVIASGVAGLAPGRLLTEDFRPEGAPAGRAVSEAAALALADRGVRSVSLRLAPTVHGDGDNGFLAAIVGIARERGVSAHVGEGDNRWPAVHRLDAARLFRLALESAPAGTVLHGVAEQGVATQDLAEVIGRQLELPVESVDAEQAADHFGWIASFWSADIPVSSDLTQELMDWQPTHPGLLEDLGADHYFQTSH